MSDADRRRRFKAWFEGAPMHGDRARLMREAAISKGRVTQLLDPDEPFGELTARRLAAAMGLREDIFTGGADDWPFETVPRERFEGLSERQKGMVEQALKDALRDIQAEPIASQAPTPHRSTYMGRERRQPAQARKKA